MTDYNGTNDEDTIVGTSGDDYFQGTGGADTLDGAGGVDTIDYYLATSGVVIDFNDES